MDVSAEISDDGRRPLWQVFAGYGACALLVLGLWATPVGHPMRLFATFVHELGHLCLAGATGADIHWIEVRPAGGGFVSQTGGWRFLVSPAGYMGTLLYGAFLFCCTSGRNLEKAGVGATALLLLVHASTASSSFGVVALLAFLALLFIATLFLETIVQTVALRTTAISLCMHGIVDLWRVLFSFSGKRAVSVWEPDVRMPEPGDFYTDATLMAATYGGSEGMWATIWLAISVAVLATALAWSIRSERNAEIEGRTALRRLRRPVLPKGEGAPHTIR